MRNVSANASRRSASFPRAAYVTDGAADGNKQKAKNKAFNRGEQELDSKNIIKARDINDISYVWNIEAEASPAFKPRKMTLH
jgi:hypothetical protein